MKRQIHEVLLCVALLAMTFAAGRGLAADDQPNKFNEAKKHDLEYTGSIVGIRATEGRVIVRGKEKAPITVYMAKECMFFTKQKKGAASLADFKPHDEVRVLYKEAGSNLVCDAMWEPGSDPSQKEEREQKEQKEQK